MIDEPQAPFPHSVAAEIADYREYPAGFPLRSHVLCVWTQTIGPGDSPCTVDVLPDGCIDIVWVGQAPPVIAGPATAAQAVKLPPGSQLVGVRFRPGRARSVLGVPAAELRDRMVQLEALWGAEALRITEPLHNLSSLPARLALIETALIPRCPDVETPARSLQAAIAMFSRDPDASVEAIAGTLGISARQLQRRFVEAVGYGPKRFQRIVRLQRLLACTRRNAAQSLAALALEVGYADQSHMTREVRELAGTVPRELLGRFDSTLVMSDLFKTPAVSGR